MGTTNELDALRAEVDDLRDDLRLLEEALKDFVNATEVAKGESHGNE
jgi:hypothetical protein